jgi:hypothetical protein
MPLDATWCIRAVNFQDRRSRPLCHISDCISYGFLCPEACSDPLRTRDWHQMAPVSRGGITSVWAPSRDNANVLVVADRDTRIVDADGELLRELVLDPTRDYQRQSA